MNFHIGKTYRWMLLITLIMAGALAVINFTGMFRLKTIRLVPAEARAESSLLRGAVGRNIFQAPVSEIMRDLLRQKDILRVEVNYDLPDGLEIVLNNIEPLAVILTPQGEMAAVNPDGYMTPFIKNPAGRDGFAFPVVTGIDEYRPYELVANHTLALVIEQLKQLAAYDREFYLQISDIDLSAPETIIIHLDGVLPDIVMYPGDLAQNMQKLKCFLVDYQPDLMHVYKLDLRAEGLIVAAGEETEDEDRDTVNNGN